MTAFIRKHVLKFLEQDSIGLEQFCSVLLLQGREISQLSISRFLFQFEI